MGTSNSREMQPGLRRRIKREARRIASQHGQLDVFYGRLLASLTQGRVVRVRSEFLRFQDALEAHFTVEERIHFPALHGLRPELDAALTELVYEHRHFREQLGRISELVEHGRLEEAGRDLDRLIVGLAAHETREERMADGVTALDD